MKSAEKKRNYGAAFKIILLFLILLSVALFIIYVMKISGLGEKISSVDELRDYISSLGGNAVLALIIFQFLQVLILPVPGVLTMGAAVALFGPLKGSIYSLIGILIGSFVAFFIGRKLGFKTVAWIVGEKVLEKTLDGFGGKDKAFLTFAFLFPFFPDDVLCFVAGLSKMSFGYFTFIIILTRLISVFLTAYSINGNLIPYDTAWGIIAWIFIFFGTVFASRVVYKNADKIENFFSKRRR